ncbi:MAG: type I-E CRISPR-associated protein Cse1/CasA [Rhodospirillaceae bacterium]
MPYNLVVDPVAPFLTASGAVRWLSLPEIAATLPGGDYAVEPAWPRADLDTATYEFLIGLLSFALAPGSISEWDRRYRQPPSVDELREAFNPLVSAFNLSGDGPLFMQEAGLQGDSNPVEALLIDTPGANAQKKNSDLLTHRARVEALSLPASAMALYALQAFAPSGGAGNLTSMRGGGPLTALVIPEGTEDGAPLPLWQRLWANVMPHGETRPSADTVFAWLRSDLPIGMSEKLGGLKIHQGTPGFDERLHPYFGMPRRIRLLFAEAPGVCGITGLHGPLVTGFVQKPYGLNYGDWRHPLTPYRRQKSAETPYSVKPKSGRFGYRDWVAVTVGDGKGERDSLSLPAENVRFARSEAADTLSQRNSLPDARIRVAGWAMNNMEAISYLAAEQPLLLANPSNAFAVDELARNIASAGEIVSNELRYAIRSVLDEKDDKGGIAHARTTFYERTDDAFHHLLAEAIVGGDIADRTDIGKRWLRHLRRAVLAILDETCPVPLDDAQKAAKTVNARAALINTLSGWSRTGRNLYGELRLPEPTNDSKKVEESA